MCVEMPVCLPGFLIVFCLLQRSKLLTAALDKPNPQDAFCPAASLESKPGVPQCASPEIPVAFVVASWAYHSHGLTKAG